MRTGYKVFLACLLIVGGSLLLVNLARALTVENISIQRMTTESALVVYGHVESTYSQWEGKTIYTYTTVSVREAIKGAAASRITVKQLGGKVNEMALEFPGSPELRVGEDVVLFLIRWENQYWIHSIVLGKFSVVTVSGDTWAYNDLSNIGLIDPGTKREVTEQNEKRNNFPLQSFLSMIRSYTHQ